MGKEGMGRMRMNRRLQALAPEISSRAEPRAPEGQGNGGGLDVEGGDWEDVKRAGIERGEPELVNGELVNGEGVNGAGVNGEGVGVVQSRTA